MTKPLGFLVIKSMGYLPSRRKPVISLKWSYDPVGTWACEKPLDSLAIVQGKPTLKSFKKGVCSGQCLLTKSLAPCGHYAIARVSSEIKKRKVKK